VGEGLTKGRNYIIAKLQERGLSRDMARRVLNQIIADMIKALQAGETVESPFGYLQVVTQDRPAQRGWYLNRIRTIYRQNRTVMLVTKPHK
jgi:nucleoid DNA-binding protein